MSDSVILPPPTTPSDVLHPANTGDSTPVSSNGHSSINGNGAMHGDHAETTPTTSADAGTKGTAEPTEQSSRVAQAEKTIDQFATKVASFTSYLGKSFLWAGSRVREAAADFWAEAQSVRHGDQP